MSKVLTLINLASRVAVLLSLPALAVAAYGLYIAISPSAGDGGMGDVIAAGVGTFLGILGALGLVFGGLLFVLSRRAMAAPFEVAGPRRTVLRLGIAVAIVELGVALLIGTALAPVAALTVGFAIAFLIVGAASGASRERMASGALAALLIAVSGLVIWGQLLVKQASAPPV